MHPHAHIPGAAAALLAETVAAVAVAGGTTGVKAGSNCETAGEGDVVDVRSLVANAAAGAGDLSLLR